jgi:hypothetical protein
MLALETFKWYRFFGISNFLSFRPWGEIHVPSRARDLLDFSSLSLLEMTNSKVTSDCGSGMTKYGMPGLTVESSTTVISRLDRGIHYNRHSGEGRNPEVFINK